MGAVASAVLAALVATAVTSLATTYLVRRSDDRRLLDAAGVLASELDEFPNPSVSAIVADEYRETSHTGLQFAVFAGGSGQRLAGDPSVPLVSGCNLVGSVRVCGVSSSSGFYVVAATTYTPLAWILGLSSLLAAAVAGLAAWLAARPVAGLLMGPLSDLREWVGSIDLSGNRPVEPGRARGIVEVDALRETIDVLLSRIGSAVRHAERFAADAAHELRTPLTTIRAELELLTEEDAMPAAATADLARVTRQVIDLQVLLERLLVLALPDQTQWSASELVSVQDLAEDAIAQLPPLDRARVRQAPARGDVVVRGDTALLATLVSNALSNALKFAHNVSVSASEDAAEVVLCVDDDGPGVSVEERRFVFEPFVRSPLAQKRQIPGHGLGLALIAHVARRHGGSARFLDRSPGAHLEIRLPRSALHTSELE